jgi:hypothetical protein
MVSEAEEPEPDDEVELMDGEKDVEPSLEDILKNEAEALDVSTLQEIE